MEVNTQQNKIWLIIKGRQYKIFSGEHGNCSELDGKHCFVRTQFDSGQNNREHGILVGIWQPQMCLMIGDKSMIMIIIKLI